MKKNKGISILEVLISIAILSILGGLSISVFSRLSNSTSLDRDATITLSYINKARTKAINSVNSTPHGIKLETNKVSIFSGTSYLIANVEDFYSIPYTASISSINLSNASTELYFNELTGTPSATGTITLSGTNTDTTKVIIIYATGLAEIQ